MPKSPKIKSPARKNPPPHHDFIIFMDPVKSPRRKSPRRKSPRRKSPRRLPLQDITNLIHNRKSPSPRRKSPSPRRKSPSPRRKSPSRRFPLKDITNLMHTHRR